MAGGEATRMNSSTEKPLLEVGGKSMLERVLDALKESEMIDRILVAVSEKTPRTAERARELNAEIISTPGDGYESDMKYVIKRLDLHDVLIVSADLPFITTHLVDHAIEEYRSSGKPALAVMIPTSIYEQLGSKPQYVFDCQGRKLAPVGINMVDGTKIDQGELDQTVLVMESKETALNVNTLEELDVARKLFRAAGGFEKHESH